MPIWAEILIIMIVSYGIGIAVAWLIWGRAAAEEQAAQRGQAPQTKPAEQK